MSTNPRFRFIVHFTIAFAVMAVVVFLPFIVAGRTFVWQVDGVTQHVKALSYFGMLLRDTLESLIDGEFQFPLFSFSLGYGADILDTLNYYVIGDPLSLFAFFVPEEATPYLYTALIVLRLYLAGLAFALFVRSVANVSHAGLLAGALTYVFCGFALFAAVRHPYFANPMIYFPLVLYGVERALRQRKHGVFALSLALSMISNFYFFYMIFIFMAFYIVMRLVALVRTEGHTVRWALGGLGRLVGSGMVGVLISCVVFLPVVMYFLQDSRGASEFAVPLLYLPKYYQGLLMNLTTTSDPGSWSFISVGVMGLMALISLFSERRSNTQLKLALVVMAVMLCLPFVGHVLNGFSYVANRWCWAFCLAASMALAVRWQALCTLSKRQALAMVGIVAVYLVAMVVANWEIVPKVGLVAVAALWLVSVVGVAVAARVGASSPKRLRAVSAFMLVVVCAGIALNAFALYLPVGGGYSKQYIKGTKSADVYRTEAQAIAQLEKPSNYFYRYSASRVMGTRNGGALVGLSSTLCYWSLSSTYVKDFLYEMGVDASSSSGFSWYNLDGQTMLYELAGVKYFAAPVSDLLPYGYDSEPLAQHTYHFVNGLSDVTYKVNKNNMPLPFGYTYSETLTSEDFEKLAPHQRREAIMQRCLVGPAQGAALAKKGGAQAVVESGAGAGVATNSEGTAEDLQAQNLALTSTSVDFDIELHDGVTRQGTIFTVAQDNATITLRPKNMPAGVEASLQVTGLNCITSKLEMLMDTAFEYSDGSAHASLIPVVMPGETGYEYRRWHTVCPGYSAAALTGITITFPKSGTYGFDNIQIIAQGMQNYQGYVSALTKDTLTNVDMHYVSTRTAATNCVTGSIDVSEPKMLCTQIPYSEGWSVRVDGQPAELQQLNVMYAGVQLQPGHHDIEFTYQTPGILAGLVATLAGFVLFGLMLLLQRKLGHRR